MDDEHSKLDLASAAPLSGIESTNRPPKVYPGLNSRLRLVMWLALVGGPLMIAMGGYETYRGFQLKTTGKQAPGRLASSKALNTGKGRISYQVLVDYKPPEGQTTYRKRFVVSEADYQRAKNGGELLVTYLTDDPTFSALGERTGEESEMFAIGSGLILFAAVLWWYLHRQTARVEEFIATGH